MLKKQMEREIKRLKMQIQALRSIDTATTIIKFLPRLTVSLEKIAECLHQDSKHIHTSDDAINYILRSEE